MGIGNFVKKSLLGKLQKRLRTWYEIGQDYENGKYEHENIEKAAECYHKAINKPSGYEELGKAAYRLANMYEFGEGFPIDYSKAAEYYNLVIDKGGTSNLHHWAKNNLGLLYKNGKGVIRDNEKAIRLFRLAYTPCRDANLIIIGGCYGFPPPDRSEYGFRCPQDDDKANDFCVNYYKAEARKGNAFAQCKLAARYADGDGIKQDRALAEKFYRLAAEQGNSEGQYNLAYYYESNYGKNDPKKAIELFQLAAEQGHYEATQVLEDKVRINAKKGDAEAQYQLAVMCLHNRHSPYGGKLSRITELSAKQGYVKAQYLLGLLYECGKYVPEGHPTGEIFGPVPRTIPNNFEPLPDSLFFMEDGVPSDFQKAIKWYLLAAKQGHKTAKQRLKKLDDSIDVEDLTVDKEKEHDKDADIQEIIKNKKVKHVVHFTRLVNLKGILSHGLITRKKIIELNILSDFNDSYRFDNQENSISCSIEFPNYKMLYKLQQDIPDTEWVVIILKPSVLWEKDCAFSNTNAASKSVTSIPIEQRKGADALKTMFDDLPEAPCREKLGIPANYPTDPQAEILVLENINPQYILNIATQSEETATRLQGIYPEFKFLYKQSIFNPRMDYNHWRSN